MQSVHSALVEWLRPARSPGAVDVDLDVYPDEEEALYARRATDPVRRALATAVIHGTTRCMKKVIRTYTYMYSARRKMMGVSFVECESFALA